MIDFPNKEKTVKYSLFAITVNQGNNIEEIEFVEEDFLNPRTAIEKAKKKYAEKLESKTDKEDISLFARVIYGEGSPLKPMTVSLKTTLNPFKEKYTTIKKQAAQELEKKAYFKATYHQDPGHGWIEVPISMVKVVEVKNYITEYSYIDLNKKVVYLEEDLDAVNFIRDFEREWGIKIKTVAKNYAEQCSEIRNLPSYKKEYLENKIKSTIKEEIHQENSSVDNIKINSDIPHQ